MKSYQHQHGKKPVPWAWFAAFIFFVVLPSELLCCLNWNKKTKADVMYSKRDQLNCAWIELCCQLFHVKSSYTCKQFVSPSWKITLILVAKEPSSRSNLHASKRNDIAEATLEFGALSFARTYKLRICPGFAFVTFLSFPVLKKKKAKSLIWLKWNPRLNVSPSNGMFHYFWRFFFAVYRVLNCDWSVVLHWTAPVSCITVS